MSNVSTEIKSMQEIVRERIQGQISGLIPDEVLNAMVDQAVENMLKSDMVESKITSAIHKLKDTYGNARPAKTSLLNSIVEGLVYAEYEKRAKELFNSDHFKPEIENGFATPAKILKEVLAENSELFVKAMLSQMMADSMHRTVMTIQSELNGRGIYPR